MGDDDGPASKRARTDGAIVAAPTGGGAIVAAAGGVRMGEEEEDDRTSGLAAPIMLLSGHKAPVYSLKFDPSGQYLASGSNERSIFLWNVYGDCENYNVLAGHKNAVLELHWFPDGGSIVTASADKTVRPCVALPKCMHARTRVKNLFCWHRWGCGTRSRASA